VKNKSLLNIFVALLLSTLLLTACAASSAQAANATSTGSVTTVTLANSIVTTGTFGASQLSALTWGTTGTVEKINVKVGQSVKTGDVLAVLSENSVPSDIVTAEADLATAQRNLQDLQESQTTQATAQQAVANAEQALKTAQQAVAGLDYPRASDTLIQNTQAKIDQARLQLARASDAYRLVARLPDGDPKKSSAELNMTNAQLNLNTLQATYDWYTGKPSTIDVDQLKANLAVATAQLADAQRNWQILQNGPDPVAVASARAQVDVAQATVNKMYILAPFDGQILTVQTAVGNPVQIGDAAFEMVNPQTLEVNTQVDETVISSVAVGDATDITLTMLPNVTLKGKVAVISDIGTTVNGLVEYNVGIALDPTTQPVRFGATANATIYTGQPYTSLSVPIAAIQSDNTSEYVLVPNADGSLQRVNVKSGALSGNLVTITPANPNALKDGDKVALGSLGNNSSQSGGNFGGGGGARFPGGFGG